jgi:hypothetical protein
MITINYSGHLVIDKSNIDLIENKSPGSIYGISKKELAKLTDKEIVDGIKSGKYILNLPGCFRGAVDGDESFNFEIDGE